MMELNGTEMAFFPFLVWSAIERRGIDIAILLLPSAGARAAPLWHLLCQRLPGFPVKEPQQFLLQVI